LREIQFIEKNGRHEYAIVPYPLYLQMTEAMEDREDIAALERFKAQDDGFRIPYELVRRELLEGEHPLKLWREHRELTLEALAEKAGISKAFLCQIENGKRQGTVKTLKALAGVLQIPVDLLIKEQP
jgi:DNA-binding XRE family transcriptional regulator